MLNYFLPAFFIVDAIGLAVLAYGFFTAKEGYQDEQGFHAGTEPKEKVIFSMGVQTSSNHAEALIADRHSNRRIPNSPKPAIGLRAGAHFGAN